MVELAIPIEPGLRLAGGGVDDVFMIASTWVQKAPASQGMLCIPT
jgi:hypothetical protein